MTEEEIAKVKRGALLLPVTAGNVVLAYHLDGVNDLRLSRDAYTGIFLGKITRWNHPLLAKSNPGTVLPDLPIQVVVRGDSSGTTFAFTTHLSAISKDCAAKLGVSSKPKWPVGAPCEGGDALVARIKASAGSIGYVEQGQGAQAGLAAASLENSEGQFVKASMAAGQSALASEDLFEDLIGWIPDPRGKDSYPIVTFTWLICYKSYDDSAKADALKDLLGWCLTSGQQRAEPLGYIPLPEKVVRRVKTVVKQIHGAAKGKE